MERAIVHSDLKKQEIQPQSLMDNYLNLLSKDIEKMLPLGSLQDASCPVTGEKEVKNHFSKMGMQYKISKTLGNIYLSPRPTMEMLRQFYHESTARKFWLTELWPKTQAARQDKIILPQLEWIKRFITQFSREKEFLLAEYLPNHFGYYNSAKDLFTGSHFTLVDPLFNPDIANIDIQNSHITNKVADCSMDAVFLFEALDRSVDPLDLLRKSFNSLKKGGLCFITSLLSSGFEVLLLGEKSEIFVPPERMNILSYEGMNALIEKLNGFDILEFSTPGVLDIPNVVNGIADLNNSAFFKYIIDERQDTEILNSFQDYLQMNRLGTFARLVLRKQ
jgi:hypothetical protein